VKAVVQRVLDASVTVNSEPVGRIRAGLLVYLGVAHADTRRDADWLAEKVAHLRIFADADEKMNLSLTDLAARENARAGGGCPEDTSPIGVLAVSQFTLLGDARKGRRPSWGRAAPPEQARELYEYFMRKIREQGLPCESGQFQAHMKVSYTNDGPVTILLDSVE
jgi:D-tyrosyl-tRNA(Tyr) deacylase